MEYHLCFFFQAEDGIRDYKVTGVQTCALPICRRRHRGDVGRAAAAWRAADRRCGGHDLGAHGALREIGRASCKGKSVDLGGRRIIKKKKQKKRSQENADKNDVTAEWSAHLSLA